MRLLRMPNPQGMASATRLPVLNSRLQVGDVLPSVESMEMVFKVLLVLLTVVVACAALTFGIHYIQVIMPLILHIILTGLAAAGHFLAGSVVGLLGNLSHVILQKLAQQVVMFTASRESIKCTTVYRCVYSSLCLPLVVFIHVFISRYVHAYSSLCSSLAVFIPSCVYLSCTKQS